MVYIRPLTPREANYANQISQMLKALQSQKMKVDQDLSHEMMKHLVKMIFKKIIINGFGRDIG